MGLLEIVIEIDLQHLKHNANVTVMGKALVGTNKVELLGRDVAQLGQHVDLHLPLLRVGWYVLEDLQRDHLVRVSPPGL